MSCSNNTKPIDGASGDIVIDGTAKTLNTLGVTPHVNAKRIEIHFNLSSPGQSSIVSRMSRDTGFTPTTSSGETVLSASKKVLTLEQFDSLFIAVSGTVSAHVAQFDLEI